MPEPLTMEPLEPAAPLVSAMTPEQVLETAEKQTAKAALMVEQMENQQYLTLGKLIDRAGALVDRLTAAADQLEIQLEVMEQKAEQIKDHAEEIKEVIEPTPTEKSEIVEAKAEAGILGHRAKLGGFLI